mmetsp:Transcript_49541/g.146369  ORF Transcript_49541/g.146369 Transcript_49541/m.146369 type:complete len:92 (-) Transcript_49541:1141-1416(-)
MGDSDLEHRTAALGRSSSGSSMSTKVFRTTTFGVLHAEAGVRAEGEPSPSQWPREKATGAAADAVGLAGSCVGTRTASLSCCPNCAVWVQM